MYAATTKDKGNKADGLFVKPSAFSGKEFYYPNAPPSVRAPGLKPAI